MTILENKRCASEVAFMFSDRMKRMFGRMFYWHDSARGACFALTWLFVGSWAWFTLLQLLWLSDCGLVQLDFQSQNDSEVYAIQAWAAGQLVILLYGVTVLLRAIWLLVCSCRRDHRYRLLFGVLAAAGMGIFGLMQIALVLFVACLLLNPVDALPASPRVPVWVPLVSEISPGQWWLVYLADVVMIVLGGFWCVESCVKGERKRLREALGKPSLACWGIFLIGYAVLAGMALTASSRVASVRSQVEAHFGNGCALSAEGLREYYQRQGRVDGDFWQRLQEADKALPNKLTVGEQVCDYWRGQLPDCLTPACLTAFVAYCQANEKALTELEKGFENVLPLPFVNFESGKLVSLLPENLPLCRRFAQLELSRLRVALQERDRAGVWRVYQRLANCNEHLRKEPFMIGSLVWLNVEGLQLDAMERMLESRLLTDDDLHLLEQDLLLLEKQTAAAQRSAMYTEAVFGQDAFLGMETGTSGAIALSPFRWFWPQLWLQVALDKAHILKQYLAEDFGRFDSHPPCAYVFSRMLLPALQVWGSKFKALSARVCAMRGLLQAEAYRRQHGDFPSELPELPTDPFTGQPLFYRYGVAEVPEYGLPELGGNTSQVRKRKVVQVWSAGRNGHDDGGVGMMMGQRDDVCARIRLE